MSDGGAFLVEDFIHSVAAQLDRVQDALRLKAVNRPLTYALKDFTLDLHVFAEMDADGHVRFRTAGANESGASTVHLAFTTITRPMIEENTVSLQATAGPSLDELGLDAAERRRLEQLGVRNASQLNRLQMSAGAGTVQRFAQLPAVRLREALQRGKPRLGNVSLIDTPRNGAADPRPITQPPSAQPPAPATPPKVSGPVVGPRFPGGSPVLVPGPKVSGPVVTPVVPLPASPAPVMPKVAVPPARLRLEGSNLLLAGLPKARVNDIEVPLANAEEDLIEVDLPVKAGVLTLELADGETHEFHFDSEAGQSDLARDPWGGA